MFHLEEIQLDLNLSCYINDRISSYTERCNKYMQMKSKYTFDLILSYHHKNRFRNAFQNFDHRKLCMECPKVDLLNKEKTLKHGCMKIES